MKTRLYFGVLTGACLTMAPHVATAQSVTTASATINVGGGYSNNPYGSSTAATQKGSPFSQAKADAAVQIASSHNTLAFSAGTNYKYYTKALPDDSSYRAGVSFEGRNSVKLVTHANARYNDSAIGSLASFDTATVDGTATDLGLLGQTNRRREFNFAAGLAYQFNGHSRLEFEGNGSLVRYKNAITANEYNTYGATAAYSRAVSNQTRIGFRAGINATDYLNTPTDTTVYSGELTSQFKLSERWSLDASGGINQLHTVGNGDRTAWTADAKLCYKGSGRAEFCANGSRKFVPTGTTGTSIQTAAGASYSQRLSERDSISANASYSRSEYTALVGAHDQYINTQLGYSHQYTKRATLDLSTSYRKVMSSNVTRGDDYSGVLSLTYRLGDIH